ncbi:hypothetical protein NEOLEDRAFT_867546 [Neolentinus lepideus HHB14362 ss-1]|uniref:Heterokaryon incompatibility domain-containing protein n=1 Tax=Neolentinus lepideus HHB14362 ss-1 TaxID=1314782 RepID=A0A165P2P2_9AGAM|nr:hypothetical protein NEOLEDRAFT_867546 [Neolentinus lepideus HHB14362 ss-1]
MLDSLDVCQPSVTPLEENVSRECGTMNAEDTIRLPRQLLEISDANSSKELAHFHAAGTNPDSAPELEPSELQAHIIAPLSTLTVPTSVMILDSSAGRRGSVTPPEGNVSRECRATGVEIAAGTPVQPLDRADVDSHEQLPGFRGEVEPSTGHGSQLDCAPQPAPPATRTRVPLQDSPAEGWPLHILSPDDASLKCKDLGFEDILGRLNEALAQRLGREIFMTDSGVRQLLERLVYGEEDLDFGGLYARVRNPWLWERDNNVDEQYSELLKLAENFDNPRKHNETNAFISLYGNGLQPWHSWARRLWDLHAHRVVPYHFAFSWGNIDQAFDGQQCYSAVSHSWTSTMADSPRSRAYTPVNAYEWPVPLPTGVTLEAVRNELLNLRQEYVWLDIVCLRQCGGPGEALRAAEWAVDVPTIGSIYQRANRVIRYYNGLGVAFECQGWTGDRHWLHRVWTIQEIQVNSITAGLPEGLTAEDLLEEKNEDGKPFKDYLDPILELEKKMEYSRLGDLEDFFQVFKELQGRTATNPIDKIAAFGSLVYGLGQIPLYAPDTNLERAWDLLLQCMHASILANFLWRICVPGNATYKWRPSWTQLMNEVTENSCLPDKPFAPRTALKDNFIISKWCRFLKGNAWLTCDHTGHSQPMAKVHYSDTVITMLKFSITLGPGKVLEDGAVHLVGNNIQNERNTKGKMVPVFVCLMVCKEVEISQGEIGYEKITVVPVKALDPSIFQAEFEERELTFV